MIAYPKGHPLSLIYLWKQIFECLNILCVHLSLSLCLSLSLSLSRARALSLLSLFVSLALALARSLSRSLYFNYFYLFVCIDMFIIGKCAHARSCMCACVEMHML